MLWSDGKFTSSDLLVGSHSDSVRVGPCLFRNRKDLGNKKHVQNWKQFQNQKQGANCSNQKESVETPTGRESCHTVLPESRLSDQSTGVENRSNRVPTVPIGKRSVRVSTRRESCHTVLPESRVLYKSTGVDSQSSRVPTVPIGRWSVGVSIGGDMQDVTVQSGVAQNNGQVLWPYSGEGKACMCALGQLGTVRLKFLGTQVALTTCCQRRFLAIFRWTRKRNWSHGIPSSC